MKTAPKPSIRTTLRQNLPALVTLLVVVVLLGAPFLYRKLQRRPTVSIENAATRKNRPAKAESASSGQNDIIETVIAKDPTVRFASRASEASALLGACGICAMTLKMDRIAITPNNIATRMVEQKLIPPMLGFSKDTPEGVVFFSLDNDWTYLYRIRENPLVIEVLALGKDGMADGEPFLLRAPESFDDSGNQVAMYLAPSVKCLLPGPFAPAGTYFDAGWARTKFDPQNYSSLDREKLTLWMASRKEGKKND